MKKLLVFFLTLFFFSINFTAAQEKMTDEQRAACETDAKVPALDRFHTVIFPMWHKYWPKRDWDGFKKIAPQIEVKADSIFKSELPGILRDKKDEWNKAVENLKTALADFKTAISANDTTSILKTAEKLHSQYEFMVRMVNPITKELNAFHVVLYNIYHYYLPDWDITKLRSAMKDLAEKKEILVASSLRAPAKMTPERQKVYDTRNEKYKNTTAKLALEVDNVVKLIESNDKDQITKAINKMHGAYQACEHIFDK